ncbi:MAG: hypothetical protein R2854_02825 [Caldilineaceae bacterium]
MPQEKPPRGDRSASAAILARASIVDEPDNRCCKAGRIAGLEKQARLFMPDQFRNAAGPRRRDGHNRSHPLENRHAQRFRQRRIDQQVGMTIGFMDLGMRTLPTNVTRAICSAGSQAHY